MSPIKTYAKGRETLMISCATRLRRFIWQPVAAAGATIALLLGLSTWGDARPLPLDTLRIGTTGSLAASAGKDREETALDTLRDFIKSETGFNNEILRQKGWFPTADGVVRGQLHLGFFQGYEFAWAQEKFPSLKPLAVAVNVHLYPTVHVVAQRNDPARSFADLAGHILALPPGGGTYTRVFVDQQSLALGKPSSAFFSSIVMSPTVEDALDDLVDGKVQAAAVERVALEAFKRLKPGRFTRLKEITHSQPFPPPLLAYQPGVLDEATLHKFRTGLLRAGHNDRGQTLLTHFRLTGFEAPAPDFDRVVAETRRAYPTPASTQ